MHTKPAGRWQQQPPASTDGSTSWTRSLAVVAGSASSCRTRVYTASAHATPGGCMPPHQHMLWSSCSAFNLLGGLQNSARAQPSNACSAAKGCSRWDMLVQEHSNTHTCSVTTPAAQPRPIRTPVHTCCTAQLERRSLPACQTAPQEGVTNSMRPSAHPAGKQCSSPPWWHTREALPDLHLASQAHFTTPAGCAGRQTGTPHAHGAR
jgi:hypothetical protein